MVLTPTDHPYLAGIDPESMCRECHQRPRMRMRDGKLNARCSQCLTLMLAQFSERRHRARSQVPHVVPDPMTCQTCGKNPRQRFATGRLSSQCKECRATYQMQRRAILQPEQPMSAQDPEPKPEPKHVTEPHSTLAHQNVPMCARCGMRPRQVFDSGNVSSWCRDCRSVGSRLLRQRKAEERIRAWNEQHNATEESAPMSLNGDDPAPTFTPAPAPAPAPAPMLETEPVVVQTQNNGWHISPAEDMMQDIMARIAVLTDIARRGIADGEIDQLSVTLRLRNGTYMNLGVGHAQVHD